MWSTAFACLALLILSAGPAFAQDDAAASRPDPALTKQLRSQIAASVAANRGRAPQKSQARPQMDATNPDVTRTCTYKFTSGSGATYLQFCVTVNGSIVEFNSPEGVEQLDQANTPDEGYGLCDQTTGVGYYDYAYVASTNWNAPTKVSSSATMVKIERTTTDGLWTLTQTITSVAGTNPYARVAMELKNNSSDTKTAGLLRYGSPVPDDAGEDDDFDEYFAASIDSAWGFLPDGNPNAYGLMIQDVGNPTPTSVPYTRYGFVQTVFEGPNPCAPTDNLAELPVSDAAGS